MFVEGSSGKNIRGFFLHLYVYDIKKNPIFVMHKHYNGAVAPPY